MTATFMSVCPKIIEMWKAKNNGLTFDEWLLALVAEHDKQKSKKEV